MVGFPSWFVRAWWRRRGRSIHGRGRFGRSHRYRHRHSRLAQQLIGDESKNDKNRKLAQDESFKRLETDDGDEDRHQSFHLQFQEKQNGQEKLLLEQTSSCKTLIRYPGSVTVDRLTFRVGGGNIESTLGVVHDFGLVEDHLR